MVGTPSRVMPPLFEAYSIDELARRLGYSEGYLLEMKTARRKPSERFMINACGILNRTRDELFGPEAE